MPPYWGGEGLLYFLRMTLLYFLEKLPHISIQLTQLFHPSLATLDKSKH